MALKIELKPGERMIVGDCVVTNASQRARLLIEGAVPILRQKDVMKLSQANSPAKRLYVAVQFMYMAKQPQDNYALYLRLAGEMLERAPAMRPLIDRINNRILTGEMYKALKEACKLIAYEKEFLRMNYASKAYAKTAKETATPRQLEASLLLKAAAQLQAVHDSWHDRPKGLNNALMYNRRLWTVFIDAVLREDNKLPATVRDNLTKLGMVVMSRTFALMTKPKPNQVASLIKINRSIATGLRGKAS